MKKIVLALALLFAASVSRADQLYAVNGSLTIVGNDVCSGLCVETVNFSFDFDEFQYPYGGAYALSIVPNSSSIASFGPLGIIGAPQGVDAPGPVGGFDENYIPFGYSSDGLTQIDLWASQGGSAQPFVPQIGGAYLWSCGTQDCMTDFCAIGKSFVGCPTSGGGINLDILGAVESVVTPIPEPGTLPLLGIAFLALFLLRCRISDRIRPCIAAGRKLMFLRSPWCFRATFRL